MKSRRVSVYPLAWFLGDVQDIHMLLMLTNVRRVYTSSDKTFTLLYRT